MNKKLFSSEIMIGITAMIISLSTLIVFIYQTNLIRKEQYMSVYPHLDFRHMYSWSPDYEFVLRNRGVGPAFITAIDIRDTTGNVYPTISNYLQDKIKTKENFGWSSSGLSEGFLLPEKEEIDLISLSRSNQSASVEEKLHVANILRDLLDDDALKITITYQSIYEEKWKVSNESSSPIKL